MLASFEASCLTQTIRMHPSFVTGGNDKGYVLISLGASCLEHKIVMHPSLAVAEAPCSTCLKRRWSHYDGTDQY